MASFRYNFVSVSECAHNGNNVIFFQEKFVLRYGLRNWMPEMSLIIEILTLLALLKTKKE